MERLLEASFIDILSEADVTQQRSAVVQAMSYDVRSGDHLTFLEGRSLFTTTAVQSAR